MSPDVRPPGPVWCASPAADASIDTWAQVVSGAHAVVHLAGLAHRPLAADASDRLTRRAALRELRRVNVLAAHRLARASAREGVRDFVFVSSIKAIGERSDGAALAESAPPRPEDCYGWAKLAAERQLARAAAWPGTGAGRAMRVCVLRPPLVYGPGVKGNFAQLQRAVAAGWPLPLASIENRRSVLHVGNLVDAMMCILVQPDAPGGCYHVCDPQPLSTPALVEAIAHAEGRPARLLRCPVVLLRALARASGRGAQLERLSGSLVLDDRRFRESFGWAPRRTTAEALAEDGPARGTRDADDARR